MRPAGTLSERAWERSTLLEPRLTPLEPESVSDGGGLPFPPAGLTAPAGGLDPEDPAVVALLTYIARQKAPRTASLPWRRGSGGAGSAPSTAGLEQWRVLARTDDEALFARGRPPRMVTVAAKRESRRKGWGPVGSSAGRHLRVARDGVRASAWRLDPTQEQDLSTEETVLRLLVTEQTWSGGTRADGRLQAPDLHIGAEELVLRMYVTPQQGFQTRLPNPETPVRVVLPEPIGDRFVVDGALYAD